MEKQSGKRNLRAQSRKVSDSSPGGAESTGKPWRKSPYQSRQTSNRQQQQQQRGSKRKVAGGKPKRVVNFDEDDRESFLSGFQRRKQERKQRAKDRLALEARDEMRRIRDQRDRKLKQVLHDNTLRRELDQHAEYSLEYELPEQTVEIKGFDIGNITNSLGLSMGVNRAKDNGDDTDVSRRGTEAKIDEKDDDDDEEKVEEIGTKKSTPAEIRENLKRIKKSTDKEMRRNRAIKAKQRASNKRDAMRKRYKKSKNRK